MNQMPNIRMISIDDKMLTSELDRAGYKKMGVTVRCASSFKEAEKVVSEGVDIIVINLDYDKVDGLQVCRHFKKKFDDEEKVIPLVLTSVQSNPQNRRAASDAGSDLFVEQPIPRQYFIEKLRKLLEQKTRGTERVQHHGDVEIQSEGREFACPIGDLSLSGILLSTDLDLKPGTPMSMTFQISGYKKPIRVDGQVVRRIERAEGQNRNVQTGIGVRFESFHGDSEKRLERWVNRNHGDDPQMIYYL